MQPATAGWRLADQRRERRLDKTRQSRLPGALQLRRIWCRRGDRLGRPFNLAGLGRPARLLAGDLIHHAPGLHRFRPLLEDVDCTGRARRIIIALDQQPVLALLARLAGYADKMPAAMELLAVELELEMAFRIALVRITNRFPAAAIPDDHRAAAILALRDRALELTVLEGMILHVHRKALLARDQARTARHRPALQHAVQLQPEIVVQAPGSVFLDDVAVALAGDAFLPRGSAVVLKSRFLR